MTETMTIYTMISLITILSTSNTSIFGLTCYRCVSAASRNATLANCDDPITKECNNSIQKCYSMVKGNVTFKGCVQIDSEITECKEDAKKQGNHCNICSEDLCNSDDNSNPQLFTLTAVMFLKLIQFLFF